MKKEQWTSVGVFIFAMITIHESLSLSIWKRRAPTSGTFPFFLGIFLALLSAVYFLRIGLKKTRERVVDDLKSQWAEEPERVLEASKVDWRKVLFTLGAIAAYPFLFMMGGYIISTAILLLFMYKFVERQKILATLIITLVTIIATYALFGLLLKVPFN